MKQRSLTDFLFVNSSNKNETNETIKKETGTWKLLEIGYVCRTTQKHFAFMRFY